MHRLAVLVALLLVAAGQDPQPETCLASFGCHKTHPADRIDCPQCKERPIPANDAACMTCAGDAGVCRHCGLPRGAQKDSAAGWAELRHDAYACGDAVFITFPLLSVSQFRINRDAERAEAHGVDGKLKASVRDGVVTLEKESLVHELILFGSSAGKLKVQVPRAQSTLKPWAPRPDELEDVGPFKPTFYYIPCEADFEGERDAPILDPDGKEITKSTRKFLDTARMEGSARLRDGRTINWAGNGRFRVVNAPNGIGASGRHIIPYRSIAVDPSVIPLNTTIYIKEAAGVKLPDGTVHDGMFYAHDTGGAIKGRRIDFFVGVGKCVNVFARGGIENMKPVTLRKVKDGR